MSYEMTVEAVCLIVGFFGGCAVMWLLTSRGLTRKEEDKVKKKTSTIHKGWKGNGGK